MGTNNSFSVQVAYSECPLLELSFRRSGDSLEEGQKRLGRAVGDSRSRSSEEMDQKTKDIWLKTRLDEGRP